jgi:hypothetical protein
MTSADEPSPSARSRSCVSSAKKGTLIALALPSSMTMRAILPSLS